MSPLPDGAIEMREGSETEGWDDNDESPRSSISSFSAVEGLAASGSSCPKGKYLWKLGLHGQRPQGDAVWQPREQRPRQHCTLIIFDWDDTLLCTTALDARPPQVAPSKQELDALAAEAVKVLSLAKTLGTVMIITNAMEGWVQQSCRKYLPKLAECIKDVDIVSARDKFENRFPHDPTKWKVEAFCEVKENSQTIANLVAVGDSSAEMEALHAMAKLYHISYTKTLKFKARPRCSELAQELQVVGAKLDTIVTSVRNYDIRLQRVHKQ
eukprot:gb/GFBE01041745.1/.p1 GENE.gb/GFBE01041745.1/~~gb/GFBE01041745.1/.p1  ORF type:complete len:269 (+),score=59.66 gb/GFBE01041745.1/:1-807(+)